MDNPLEKVIGNWQALSGTVAGMALGDEVVSATTLCIGPHSYEVNLAGNIDRGSCEFESSTMPIKMKIFGQEGPNAGKTYLAILEFVKADEIRVAYDLSGSTYPSCFDPTTDKHNYVASFRRI